MSHSSYYYLSQTHAPDTAHMTHFSKTLFHSRISTWCFIKCTGRFRSDVWAHRGLTQLQETVVAYIMGRVTKDIPAPEEPKEIIDIDTLTATPYPLQTLLDEHFRAIV